MNALLQWIVVFLVLTLALMGAVVAATSWHLVRRSRLAPDVETGAPIGWLWSPRQPARLHRRLQGAVSQVHVPMPTARRRRNHAAAPRPAADLATELVRQATALDADLLSANRLTRRQRRPVMRRAEADVRAIEQLAARIRHQQLCHTRSTVSGFGLPDRAEALTDLAHRLDLLDQANAELAAVEAATIGTDPEQVLRNIAPRPAPSSPRPTGVAPLAASPPALPPAPPAAPGFTAEGLVATPAAAAPAVSRPLRRPR